MLLAGIYSVRMDSRLKTSGMTTITVIIYWDWYKVALSGDGKGYCCLNPFNKSIGNTIVEDLSPAMSVKVCIYLS